MSYSSFVPYFLLCLNLPDESVPVGVQASAYSGRCCLKAELQTWRE